MRNASLLVLLPLSMGLLLAQEGTVETHISTQPDGGRFSVDGKLYYHATTFVWPIYSQHAVSVEPVQTIGLDVQYTFVRWKDTTGRLSQAAASTSIFATPDQNYIIAEFTQTGIPLRLRFSNCSEGTPPGCVSPGKVMVNNTVYDHDADIWLAPGTQITVTASPSSGYYFRSWGSSGPVAGSEATQSFVLNGPVILNPAFEKAASIRIDTTPSGLQVVADGVTYPTPVRLAWGNGTTHTIGVVTQQRDSKGRFWVFTSWSNGGSELQTFTVPITGSPAPLVATFLPGVRVSLVTLPANLKLVVDGTDNWPGYNFIWGVGSKHSISAPAKQVDERGRPFVFQSWSNGGGASQEVTVDVSPADTGFRLAATYQMLGRLSVLSAPVGIQALVDGSPCPTPCTVDRTLGTAIQVEVPDTLVPSDGTRIDFRSWSDGQGRQRSLVAAQNPITVTANYQVRCRLRGSVTPDATGALVYSPQSPDGYFDQNERVTVSVQAKPGYRFRKWDGAVSGPYHPAILAMTGPMELTAILEKGGPGSNDAIVLNAAGVTPDDVVAPGSIVSIYGEDLAPELKLGTGNPLPQSLSDVSVMVGGRLLALLFVAPGQINAQLPSNLSEGTYELDAIRAGRSRVVSQFHVARNAPGLFTWTNDDGDWAVAFHADGKLITPGLPAVPGEEITLYGTGFGPCEGQSVIPDGFAVPVEPPFPLSDTRNVTFGELTVQPEWAGALAGAAGLQSVRVRIPGDSAASAPLNVKLMVNQRTSNTVRLPVKPKAE